LCYLRGIIFNNLIHNLLNGACVCHLFKPFGGNNVIGTALTNYRLKKRRDLFKNWGSVSMMQMCSLRKNRWLIILKLCFKRTNQIESVICLSPLVAIMSSALPSPSHMALNTSLAI
jgi:hypothetical protein